MIVTGTTGGVGAYQKPPLWMKPGDTIEVEISNIGVLRNPGRAGGVSRHHVRDASDRHRQPARGVRPIFDAIEARLTQSGCQVVPYRSLDAFRNDPHALTDADVLVAAGDTPCTRA